MRKNVARFFILSIIVLFTGLISCAQSNHPLEPAEKYYKTLSELSSKSNGARAWMDTIRFPWSEYSQNALSYSMIRTVYLLPADEAKLPTLIKAPANSSDQTRAELDYLLSLQQSRTKSQIERAQYIANIGSWFNILNPSDPDFEENRKQLFYIVDTVGSWENYRKYPATIKLLMNCIQDIRVTEFRLKWHFKRPRPYHLEPALQPLARIKSPSFASGHTLWAYTEAYIFSELLPAKRTLFLQRADEVRWSRELLGIHYPSDNEASRVIGWNLLQYWFKNPKFKDDLDLAKKEWK